MGGISGWGRRGEDRAAELWPKDENGEPLAPAFLLHTDELDYDDELTLSMLRAFGIPALRRYPQNGEFGSVILGMSGNGVDIYVPETMLADARNIISAEISEDE